MLSSSGKKEYGGLVFDAINYLARKLNFTYTVLSPASNRTLKFKQNETQDDVVRRIYDDVHVLIERFTTIRWICTCRFNQELTIRLAAIFNQGDTSCVVGFSSSL